ncbi:MAG TPA: hypothetical protein VGO06_00615 [Bosea sp. (in: a-proteobacteria)]|uniref:hypothetical protein n=1 Tax=Bosea sp. (in: a-proteobacteria) TaxID=1871050 RepID=UPI002E10C144|nr:hypothetical protein [Bosea sp. (in: a-proteobacteria)]
MMVSLNNSGFDHGQTRYMTESMFNVVDGSKCVPMVRIGVYSMTDDGNAFARCATVSIQRKRNQRWMRAATIIAKVEEALAA